MALTRWKFAKRANTFARSIGKRDTSRSGTGKGTGTRTGIGVERGAGAGTYTGTGAGSDAGTCAGTDAGTGAGAREGGVARALSQGMTGEYLTVVCIKGGGGSEVQSLNTKVKL